jgi:hypothetical protein
MGSDLLERLPERRNDLVAEMVNELSSKNKVGFSLRKPGDR